MLATNAIGPFLLTELLKPVLLSTAKSCLSGSVRVVWVSSIIALGTPKGGIVVRLSLSRAHLLSMAGFLNMHSFGYF
jgi:NAD(P)-dependent dehydrogenase (short-subunit alcohol dehydrogenase family)